MTSLSPNLSAWRSAGTIQTVQGRQIFVREQGDGSEAILCIHGFPTSSYDWLPIWETITEQHRVIATDLLGFGFSDKPTKHVYTIAEQADLILSLLQTLGVQDVHILSHDYGTIVAQELIARQQLLTLPVEFKIKSVTFLNGALFPEMHRPRLIQKLLLSPVGSIVSRLFNERSFKKAFLEVFGKDTQPSDQELKDYWALIAYNDGNRISHRLMNYFRERKVYRDRWVTAMQATSIPLAVINGPADPVSGQHLLDRVRQDLPQATIFALPTIGHYPQVEAPIETAEYFLSVVEKI